MLGSNTYNRLIRIKKRAERGSRLCRPRNKGTHAGGPGDATIVSRKIKKLKSEMPRSPKKEVCHSFLPGHPQVSSRLLYMCFFS